MFSRSCAQTRRIFRRLLDLCDPSCSRCGVSWRDREEDRIESEYVDAATLQSTESAQGRAVRQERRLAASTERERGFFLPACVVRASAGAGTRRGRDESFLCGQLRQ